MTEPVIAAWHNVIATGNFEALRALLAEDVCFHSPVVYRPQQGKALTAMYLIAAYRVFDGNGFRYVREVVAGNDAVLEFMVTLGGIEINGVDLIRWNDAGKIVDFKVMVRPWKAMETLRTRMLEMLEKLRLAKS